MASKMDISDSLMTNDLMTNDYFSGQDTQK